MDAPAEKGGSNESIEETISFLNRDHIYNETLKS